MPSWSLATKKKSMKHLDNFTESCIIGKSWLTSLFIFCFITMGISQKKTKCCIKSESACIYRLHFCNLIRIKKLASMRKIQ